MEKQVIINEILALQREVYETLEAKEPFPWLNLNLTRGQLHIIFLLSCQERMTPGTIADALGVPRANVTGVIDRLVTRGFVSREEDPEDRRSYIVRLTNSGQSAVDQFRDWHIARMGRMLSKMRQDDLVIFAAGLKALLRVVKD